MYFNNSTLVNVNVPPEQQAAMWTKILRDAAWLYALTAEDIAAFLEEPQPEPDFIASLGTLSEEN